MKIEDYPNLLIRRRLTEPLQGLAEALGELQSYISPDLARPLLRGAFAIAVSYFEVGLADCLKYYLTQFPQKLPKDDLRLHKDELLSDQFRLREAASNKYVIGLTHRPFPEFFGQFIELLSLDWSPENLEFEETIQEIRATRNLLLHNTLRINDLYIEQAGKKRRSEVRGDTLPLDLDYVQSAIATILDLQAEVLQLINRKYRAYTVVAANQRLWEFLFTSPVMPYSDFWEVDEEKDRILAWKTGKYEKGLSSTEFTLLGLWRAQFSGRSDYLVDLSMRRYTQRMRDMIMFFLSVSSDFDFE